jgi:DNA processing protein
MGELLQRDRRAVAVVGSRRATPYGARVARSLAGDLARAGVTIVSGLARGIDAAAHEAALTAGGRTVAVLGSGLLDPYPPEHDDLLARVAGSGAVLSEFALHAPPRRLSFPRRNRVVAALGLAVIVVEAAARSGALSTAGHALDLGRHVLAVPGPVDKDTGRGSLRLLQEGATPVGSAQDVFAALGWCQAAKSDLPPEERRVLEALRGRAATPEDIAGTLAMSEEVAAGLLVSLELRSLIKRVEGGKYAVT